MKLRLLDYGTLTADEGWVIEAAGVATKSNPEPKSKRRAYQMIGALIEHPKKGLILYEAGPASNHSELWPDPVKEVFDITRYEEENRLDTQLKKAGYSVNDVSAIIIGHMHLDHAGGLELFRGLDVPVYVHEDELKYAFYAIATKQDFGAYIPHYIDSAFNWQAVHGDEFELFEGITLYKTPGHTPGLLAMKAKLNDLETFLFTSDTIFFKENWVDQRAPGWLIRDMPGWFRSLAKLKNIADRENAKVIFGHDPEVFAQYAGKVHG
ncbi:N-acyl homoserine lactonase family protein [Desulfobacula sp.]|uniref:N-acyl homoserine lactonase family protein n=1 Tax=Desulfobacula sp. TaxID=2593537 RepID=UPI002615AB45|nr:N-acyl homoserine lactonase family protein [Desulfobacula sp.]